MQAAPRIIHVQKRALAIALALMIGGGLLGVGYLTLGYWQAVTINLGSAVLLAVPLVYFGQLLTSRISEVGRESQEAVQQVAVEVAEVRQQADETAASLADLTAVTHRRVEDDRGQDDELAQGFRNDLAQPSLRTLLDRGLELGAISRRGFQVPITPAVWVRFVPGNGMHGLLAETAGTDVFIVDTSPFDPDSEMERALTWGDTESAESFMHTLAEALMKRSLYPGDDGFDPTQILADLADGMSRLIDRRTRGKHPQVEDALAICGEWVITEDSVRNLTVGYSFEPVQVYKPGFIDHLSTKHTLDADQFPDLFDAVMTCHPRVLSGGPVIRRVVGRRSY